MFCTLANHVFIGLQRQLDQQFSDLWARHTTPWVKKGCHSNRGYNFVNSWWICKIFFTAVKSSKLPTKPILGYPPHLKCVLRHYLGKLKNQKFCILNHAKHVSNVTFYHLSNRCLPNVLKINVKINTMQNTNILLFVRSPSLTNSRNAF